MRVLKLAKKFLPNGAAKKLLNDAADCAGAEARNSAMILLASYFKDFKFDIRLEERPSLITFEIGFGIDGFYELKGVEQVCSLSNGGSGNIAQNFADRAFANYKRTSVILKSIGLFQEDLTIVEALRKIVLEKGEAAINETITELDYDSLLNRASDAFCKENGETMFESNLGLDFKLSNDQVAEVVPFENGQIDIVCKLTTVQGEFELEVSRSSCLIFPKRISTIGPFFCELPPI